MTTLPLRVTVAPERADAAPGDALTLDVTVRNASDVVEHYGVELLGLPDGAIVRTEPDVAKLRPAESATVSVRITLPVQPPSPAGTYVAGVLVRSKYRHEVSRCVEVPVQLASVEQISVRATPEVVTGGRAGRYTIEVTNDGNSPVRLLLATTDPERRVTATFDPPSLDLPPGTTARTLLVVQAPLPWNREKQHPLTITATPDLPGAAAGSGTASFVQKPRFASKFAKVAGIGAAVLLVAAAVAVPALISLRAGDEDPTSGSPTVPVAVAPTAAVPSAALPSPIASATAAPPSAAVPSEQPSAPAPPGVGSRTVDLTSPGDGVVLSDQFRADGFLIRAEPASIAVPGCENATVAAVVTDQDGTTFLTSANPDDVTDCHSVPVSIDFFKEGPAGALRLTPVTKGALEMTVGYADLSQSVEPSLTVSADKARAHGGVDYVLVRPRSDDGAATAPVALTELTISPLS